MTNNYINKITFITLLLTTIIASAESQYTEPKIQPRKGDPKLDVSSKLLPPEFLALIREVEGTEFEEKIMQNFSTKGMDDPKVQELTIAFYLSRKNYDAARFWLLRAQAKGQPTPAWQRLALALADNDQKTAADILNKEGDKLTPIDRVETLKRINKPDDALKLLDNYLQTSDSIGIEQRDLYQYRNALAIQQSSQVDMGFNFTSLGILDITQSQARSVLPISKKALAFQFRHNYLSSSGNEFMLPANNEFDLSVEGKFPFQSNRELQFNMGGNLRNDESLAYGSVGLTSKLTDYLESNFRVGLNEMSTETAFLRALGAKDKVSLGLTAKLNRQSFFQLDIDGHRYLTRQGSTLGGGYRINTILSYTLLQAMPTWQVRLQGSTEGNSLKDGLPPELRTSVPSPSATVDTIVSRDYSSMGIGTTLRYGLSELEIPREPFILVDGWSGWAWPANELAYTGRVGVGVSPFKADVLSVGAFYGTVQGGKAGQAYQGTGVQYSIRF
ncbi:MAG: hypothetical protein QX198_07480 [Methylococcaceae bacterium]